METEEVDKIYSQLQARCAKCNNPITSIAQAKSKKDKDGNSVVLCLSCSEKCKNEYRDATEEEVRESALTVLLAMLTIGKTKF